MMTIYELPSPPLVAVCADEQDNNSFYHKLCFFSVYKESFNQTVFLVISRPVVSAAD